MTTANSSLRVTNRARPLLMACIIAVLAGCAGSGEVQTSGSVYVGVGVGYYDPWYWGPGYYPPPGAVGPPPPSRPDARPPHPEQPIAKPPPSRPSSPPARPAPAPRPAAAPRGGGRGGGRR